jgi:hypothetical protein
MAHLARETSPAGSPANHGDAALDWWLRTRKMIPKPLRCGFDSFVFLVGWILWKERNSRTFNGVASQAMVLINAMQEEGAPWCSTGNKHLRVLLVRV